MASITPFLWFESQAEEAMNFYASIFNNSKVLQVSRANGRVIAVTFEIEGQKVMALNGGAHHTHNEAFSFFIGVDSQEELDALWTQLTSDGGAPSRCGWLKDKFGVSWQVVPKDLGRMMNDPDPKKCGAVMQTLMPMNKIDIAALKHAYQNA
jgi:predicted 3-demethylubiquinone-9 3-methyltransferase (glyoxalase superfamily)